MPKQPKRGVAEALWRAKAQRNRVPTMKEMIEAKRRAGPFPEVSVTRRSRGDTIAGSGAWECAPNSLPITPSGWAEAGDGTAAATGTCETRATSRKSATLLTAKRMMYKTNWIENTATMATPMQIDKPFSQESHTLKVKRRLFKINVKSVQGIGPTGTQNSGKHEQDADAEFVCTACGRSVPLVEVQAHPMLHVGICKHCYDFQVSDPFTKDNPQDPFWHENECRWCGDGGELILCDSCPKAFCKFCIRRNFGEEILSAIESPPREWSCFVCNDDHLQILSRDLVQATLIGDLLKTLTCDYTAVENLVKTRNGSGQPQKSRTSRFEGESSPAAAAAEENNNRSSLLHHQDEHKKAVRNDFREDKATPIQHATHFPNFCIKLTATNIGIPGSFTARFVLPVRRFMSTYGTKVQAFVQFQGIHADSPVHVISCRRYSGNKRKVHLLSSEWNKFVKDNGLEEGHCLHFSLVADSCFVVRKM